MISTKEIRLELLEKYIKTDNRKTLSIFVRQEMHKRIAKYPVNHPILKKYIKFFWEVNDNYMQLNHKVISSRNINLRFNLENTPYCVHNQGKKQILEDVFFSGLFDKFTDTRLKTEGKTHLMGICFYPDGFFPFSQIPVSEFKNQLLNATDTGLNVPASITEQLKETPDIAKKLLILEDWLLSLLNNNFYELNNFQQMFRSLQQNNFAQPISAFCQQNNIGIRKIERMFNKYVGTSAKTFSTINRFQNGLRRILNDDYDKFTDIAYSNDYFDQMHYIKEFKRFTGSSPKNFVRQKDSMMQIGKWQ